MLEPKRFIGSDLKRLFERIRNEFGPDAVVIRTRSLMREGAEPLTEILAAAGDGPGGPPLNMQQSIATGLMARLEAIPQSLTIGDLEDLVARDALPPVEPETAGIPSPDRDLEPGSDWLEGFVGNAPPAPAIAIGERVPGVTARPGANSRSIPAGQLEETAAPAGADVTRPLAPLVRRRPGLAPARPAVSGSPSRPPVQPAASYVDDLVAAGLSLAAARIVFQSASWESDRRRALAATLEQRRVRYPDESRTAVITMQGPVGAGKTTALVRMALDCLDAGREAVLVAADTAHVGARTQIHDYADATGLAAVEAFDRHDIARVATRARSGACIFVDLPAGPWQPPRGFSTDAFNYLVLPAHWQSSATEAAIAPFAMASFAGCVITFSDIATTLAPVLSTVLESRLGIAFLSSNRDVGSGIGVADPLTLASGIFTIRTGETTYGRLAASA